MLCLPADAPELTDLATGARRAVMVVHAVEAAQGKSGSFLVRHTGTGGETRIGLFPGGAFSEDAGDQARRYMLPRGVGEDGTVCYEVRYLAPDGAAKVSLTVSDPL